MTTTTDRQVSAAVLTIQRPGAMTKKDRRDIAAWLRRQADDFERLGGEYSDRRFTARYTYLADASGKVRRRRAVLS